MLTKTQLIALESLIIAVIATLLYLSGDYENKNSSCNQKILRLVFDKEEFFYGGIKYLLNRNVHFTESTEYECKNQSSNAEEMRQLGRKDKDEAAKFDRDIEERNICIRDKKRECDEYYSQSLKYGNWALLALMGQFILSLFIIHKTKW